MAVRRAQIESIQTTIRGIVRLMEEELKVSGTFHV